MSNKILTAYYSHSGNTGEIASYIQKQTDGALFEIIPAVPFPTGYNDIVRQAKIEIQSGKKPELKTKINDTESYDIIFVGSPNWWGTIAPPVAAFLSEHDFSAKTIVPFCTHGGGGYGSIFKDISLLCPNSNVLNGFDVFDRGNGNFSEKITLWLSEIGIK